MRGLRGLLLTLLVSWHAASASFPSSAAVDRETLWISNGSLTGQGRQLLNEILVVEHRGLRPADYNAADLQHKAVRLTTASAKDRATFDVSLTAAATRLVQDLHNGRVKPGEIGYDLDLPRPSFDALAAVRSLATSGNVSSSLDALEPQLHHYMLLKSALARYRELAAHRPGFVALPALPRSRVRPGEHYQGAPELRDLLAALGDMPSANDPAAASELDPTLVEGLKRFQARHGLDVDGILGKATFRALNTPFSARVQQIELSMERMRWLPPFETPPIIVNIPQFRLFAFRTREDRAENVEPMDVIVGEAFEGHRTPVFAADMKYVVLNPYWDVPRSILVKELLPDFRRNPEWLDSHGYEIVRGEGDDGKVLPATPGNVDLLVRGGARLRQKPGPKNPLGRVKFMFPNRHNVYLHDTPARALLQRSRRAFSHGCIRVSNPMTLLAHVMRDDPSWTEERRDALLADGKPARIALRRPIRVLILYGTALATESGDVKFFEDIYGQDAPLIARLASRR